MKRIKARYLIMWKENDMWIINVVEMTGVPPRILGKTREIIVRGIGLESHIMFPEEYNDKYARITEVEAPSTTDTVIFVQPTTFFDRILIDFSEEQAIITLFRGR